MTASTNLVNRKRSDALPPPPKEAICAALKINDIKVEWLAGDGSDRCYYRLISPELSGSLVLMQLSEIDANKLREDGYDWLKVARILKAHELKVPAPIVNMNDHAALIIEDYGDVMLESLVEKAWEEHRISRIDELYDQCFGLIQKMLSVERSPDAVWCQRSFDAEKFSWELHFFRREFLTPVMKHMMSPKEEEKFNQEVCDISKFLAGFSVFFTHRDFHSRNIMVKEQDLALIDFQDARLGAASYDLVSLIFDNYVSLSQNKRLNLLSRGLASIEMSLNKEQRLLLHESYAAVMLQRQLKAIGTYGFLTVNKKRGNYLKYVLPAVESLDSALVGDKRWPFLSRELPKMIAGYQLNERS